MLFYSCMFVRKVAKKGGKLKTKILEFQKYNLNLHAIEYFKK